MSCSPTAWPIISKQGCFLQLDLLRVFMPGGVLRSLLPTAVMLVLAWGVYRGRRFAAIGTVVVDILQVFVAVVYYLFIPLTLSDGGFSALVRHGAMFACIATALPSLLFAVALIMSMSQFNIARRLASSGARFVCHGHRVPRLRPGCSSSTAWPARTPSSQRSPWKVCLPNCRAASCPSASCTSPV